MSWSEVDVCNFALSRIGNGQTITSLDEASQEAATCSLFYEMSRDKVLRDFDWPFARVYAALSLIEEDPNDDWEYSYKYPTDCIKFRRIVTGLRSRSNITPLPHQIAKNASGRVIFTDKKEAVGIYTARVEDPSLFDPAFVSMLAWRLGVDIALPLAVERQRRQDCLQMYEDEKRQAWADALNEEQHDDEPETESIRSRD